MLIKTSQTGGEWHNDTSPFSIPCFGLHRMDAYNEGKSPASFCRQVAVWFPDMF